MTQKPDCIRVAIVDDHPFVRDGVRLCLESQPGLSVVGEAGDAQAGEAMIRTTQPDLALIDIGLRGESGLDLIARLQTGQLATRLIVLTMYDSPGYVAKAMAAGARAYVLKDAPAEELFAAIEAVLAGGSYYSSGISNIFPLPTPTTATAQLTQREKEVLGMLAEGANNKQIAAQLGMSVRTVETHRLNIKRKVGIEGTSALLKYAFGRTWEQA